MGKQFFQLGGTCNKELRFLLLGVKRKNNQKVEQEYCKVHGLKYLMINYYTLMVYIKRQRYKEFIFKQLTSTFHLSFVTQLTLLISFRVPQILSQTPS